MREGVSKNPAFLLCSGHFFAKRHPVLSLCCGRVHQRSHLGVRTGSFNLIRFAGSAIHLWGKGSLQRTFRTISAKFPQTSAEFPHSFLV